MCVCVCWVLLARLVPFFVRHSPRWDGKSNQLPCDETCSKNKKPKNERKRPTKLTITLHLNRFGIDTQMRDTTIMNGEDTATAGKKIFKPDRQTIAETANGFLFVCISNVWLCSLICVRLIPILFKFFFVLVWFLVHFYSNSSRFSRRAMRVQRAHSLRFVPCGDYISVKCGAFVTRKALDRRSEVARWGQPKRCERQASQTAARPNNALEKPLNKHSMRIHFLWANFNFIYLCAWLFRIITQSIPNRRLGFVLAVVVFVPLTLVRASAQWR